MYFVLLAINIIMSFVIHLTTVKPQKKVQKEAVSPFHIMLYAYRAVMAVRVGILYDFPILYFVLLTINVCL